MFQRGYTTTEVIFLLVWLVSIIGWVLNIVKIVDANFDPITGMVVLRCIGVFVAPLGAVLGFL